MIKAAIIDDEFHGINALQHLIKKYCPEVEIVFTTQQSTDAPALIERHKPGLVFLDIEMPLKNGIELLKEFSSLPFKVVFTTAYDQYAIQAIRLNALDYLLKPVDRQELRAAVDKYLQNELLTTPVQVAELQRMQHEKVLDTIALSTSQGLTFVKLADIMLLEAVSCYTSIFLEDGTKHLVSKTLALFEEALEGQPGFFRAHKSYMVNLKFIKKYIKGEGGEIVMQNDQAIALSRNKKQEFLALFTKI